MGVGGEVRGDHLGVGKAKERTGNVKQPARRPSLRDGDEPALDGWEDPANSGPQRGGAAARLGWMEPGVQRLLAPVWWEARSPWWCNGESSPLLTERSAVRTLQLLRRRKMWQSASVKIYSLGNPTGQFCSVL